MLKQSDAALVVIDVQERLLPFIHESERTIAQIVRLVRGFQILEAPVFVTEQYRKGLGPTDPRIVEAVTHQQTVPAPGEDPSPAPAVEFTPIEKMTFSCAEHPPFMEELSRLGRRQIVLCGIESHVCVLQTALHLRERGHEVFLAADAVSSRSASNVEIALRRMEQEGVMLTSVEMAVFEALHACGTPAFKAWSRLIR